MVGCAVDPSGVPARNGDDDASVNDASTDFSVPDGPVTPDLGRDSGVDLGPDVDMAMPDDLGVDQGPPDLGPPDLGPPDLGPPDLGPPDLGPPDMFMDGGCGTAETCNAVDDDCDGAIDENPGGDRGENICPTCTRAVSPGGVTYQICPVDVSWSDALAACRVSDYELASPETMAEDAFLDMVLLPGDDYWIGLNQRDGDGWEWEDRPSDRPLGAFDDWRSDEPNGSGDCARIDRDDDQWRDSDCNGGFQDSFYFVCEAP